MAVRIIRAPAEASPAKIKAWTDSVQKVAEENQCEVEIKSRDEAGNVIAFCVATPRSRLEKLLGR